MRPDLVYCMANMHFLHICCHKTPEVMGHVRGSIEKVRVLLMRAGSQIAGSHLEIAWKRNYLYGVLRGQRVKVKLQRCQLGLLMHTGHAKAHWVRLLCYAECHI